MLTRLNDPIPMLTPHLKWRCVAFCCISSSILFAITWQSLVKGNIVTIVKSNWNKCSEHSAWWNQMQSVFTFSPMGGAPLRWTSAGANYCPLKWITYWPALQITIRWMSKELYTLIRLAPSLGWTEEKLAFGGRFSQKHLQILHAHNIVSQDGCSGNQTLNLGDGNWLKR